MNCPAPFPVWRLDGVGGQGLLWPWVQPPRPDISSAWGLVHASHLDTGSAAGQLPGGRAPLLLHLGLGRGQLLQKYTRSVLQVLVCVIFKLIHKTQERGGAAVHPQDRGREWGRELCLSGSPTTPEPSCVCVHVSAPVCSRRRSENAPCRGPVTAPIRPASLAPP